MRKYRTVDPLNPRSVALSEGQERRVIAMQDLEFGYNPNIRPRAVDMDQLTGDSFMSLAKRLSRIGWVIVERPLGWDGEGCWVLVHKDRWGLECDYEPLALRGLGGQTLGLPPEVARLLHAESIRYMPGVRQRLENPDGPVLSDLRRAHNALHPPRYREFLTLGFDALWALEEAVVESRRHSPTEVPDLDELQALLESFGR